MNVIKGHVVEVKVGCFYQYMFIEGKVNKKTVKAVYEEFTGESLDGKWFTIELRSKTIAKDSEYVQKFCVNA